ncbi:hypothetical protein SCA6_003516 [Theobroma cacao]
MDFLGGAESQKTESSPKCKLVGSKHYALSSRVALKPICTTGQVTKKSLPQKTVGVVWLGSKW